MEAGCKIKGKLGILFLWRWEDRMWFYAEWKNPIEDDRLMKQQEEEVTKQQRRDRIQKIRTEAGHQQEGRHLLHCNKREDEDLIQISHKGPH